MSRETIHTDYRLTVVTGDDHLLGRFYQIYDRDMEQETSEGEGLVLEWSERFGYDTNVKYMASWGIERTNLSTCRN